MNEDNLAKIYEVAEEAQAKLHLLMGLLRAVRMDKERKEREEKAMRLNKIESEVNNEKARR